MQLLQGVSLIPPELKTTQSQVTKAESNFGEILGEMVSGVNNQQQEADLAIQQLHAGGERNLHEVMISMEQADISLRYMVQVRNKALEAYQEIMRLQV